MLLKMYVLRERRATIRGAEELQSRFYKTNYIFPSAFLHFPDLEACKTTNFERRRAPLRAYQTSLRGAHQLSFLIGAPDLCRAFLGSFRPSGSPASSCNQPAPRPLRDRCVALCCGQLNTSSGKRLARKRILVRSRYCGRCSQSMLGFVSLAPWRSCRWPSVYSR